MPLNNKNKINKEEEERNLLKKEVNRFLDNNFKWLILLVVALIFVLSFFGLIKPKYEETLKLRKITSQPEGINTEERSNELEKMKNFLLAYGQVEAKQIEKIEKIIPNKYNKEELFTELNQIVSANGLILQTISLSDGGLVAGADFPSGKVRKVKINLNVGGTNYSAFKSFLFSLENSLRLFDIINVNFSPGGESTSLVMDTYYFE